MIRTILKKNDMVMVITGADKGKRGKILFVDRKRGRVVVEGVNVRKKFVRPSQDNPKGGQIELPYPINISNVMVFCDKCKKAVQLGMKIDGDTKYRICKKCGKRID
ncbi:MAG TPA: 50S ribosomal protein L24 [Spirochaetota bacterium]|nr:50S ribosomal protein L24 [Spirochaetota bacterium]HOM87486.1 50S ribosomal protein L24 [Spirochaetota bacterium]HOR93617.1 50S ribosomal protein L24 [Spirochaetota bacterium]HOT18877.1 50S ribosomal protein L24 [Spirochaetota bacterium]HPD04825.1 50S ribosomal protein L24 [Spirochaetota bacterium]